MTSRLATALLSCTLLTVAAACNKPADVKPQAAATPAAGAPLTMAGSVDIPGYKGDFDHFDVDIAGDRLFLAGEEGKTLEIFKLSTGDRIKTLTDQVEVPHSLLYMPAADELLVVDGGPGGPRVLDGKTYAVKRHYKMPAPGSDSVGYDAKANRLWVVSGGKDIPLPYSYLTEIDPATGKIFHNIKFDANHVEAMAIDPDSDKLWISVADKNKTAIVDRKAGKVIGEWPVTAAQQNAPMTYDPKTRRLFIVTRKPGMLLVVNADTGATVASFKAPERTDQVVWDPINRRVYVTGGEGYISVVQQADADHYAEIGRIPSAPGAKTAILTPDAKRLYVAASPGESGAMGKVIRYDVGRR
jgi:DNA-binding beta-propeller fold protein YncE